MAEKKHSVHFDITAQDKASAALAAVEKNLTRVVLAAVSIGGIGASFTSFMEDAIKTRSALDDLSDTTGDNVRTLDGLRRQAVITGLEFEQMSGGLTKFARNLNASDDQGKAAAQAIEAIGLKVSDLRAMKPADAMIEVAKALGGFEDGASKVAVAVALMGKEGAKMLPFMKDIAEAGELNGRITAEQAAQAERTEKEWRKLTQAFKDGKDFMADGLIPVLGDYAEQMRKGIELTGGLRLAIATLGSVDPTKTLRESMADTEKQLKSWQESGAIGKFFDKPFGMKYAEVEGALQKRLEFLKFMERQQALKMTGPQFLDARDLRAAQKPKLDFVPTGPDKGVDTEMRLFTTTLQSLEKEYFNLTAEGKVALVQWEEQHGSLKLLTEGHKAEILAMAEKIDAHRRLIAVQEQGVELVKSLDTGREAALAIDLAQAKAYRDQLGDMSFGIALIGKTTLEQERLNAARAIDLQLRKDIDSLPKDDAGDLLPTSERRAESMRQRAEQQKKGVDDLILSRRTAERDWLTGVKGGMEEYMDTVTNAAMASKQLFTDTWKGAEDALVKFTQTGKLEIKDLVSTIGADLARIGIRNNITGPLAAASGDIFKSLGAALFGGGKASGGDVSSGTTYLVGENGPELFTPSNNGNIIPNNALRGGGDTYNIYAPGADKAGLAMLANAIRAVNGSIGAKSIAAWKNYMASRGIATP